MGGSVVVAGRLRLALEVPVALYQDGESAVVDGVTLSPSTAPAFGDVRLAADVRVVGNHGEPFSLALGVRGWLPTGLRSQFTSDGSVSAIGAGVGVTTGGKRKSFNVVPSAAIPGSRRTDRSPDEARSDARVSGRSGAMSVCATNIERSNARPSALGCAALIGATSIVESALITIADARVPLPNGLGAPAGSSARRCVSRTSSFVAVVTSMSRVVSASSAGMSTRKLPRSWLSIFVSTGETSFVS